MKKKRTYTTLSILLLTLALLLSSCQGAAEPMETGETKGVATTPGVAQTTEPTETPAATTEKTAEMTRPAWTDKNPAVNEKDFVLSPVKLEKIDQIWSDAMIKDPCAVEIILQPYASGKEYTEEDFKDVGCTEIVIYQLRVYEGYHCRKITFFFENPTQSPNYATQVYEKLEEKEDVYMVNSTVLYQPLAVPDDYVEGTQWAIEQISLPEAWDISTGSPTVYVGIIDSGIKEPF